MPDNLTEFVLNLYAAFGPTKPMPQGAYFIFRFIIENTTYEKALKRVKAVFDESELYWASLSIQPGPEKKESWNRSVKVAVDKDLLIPRRSHLP